MARDFAQARGAVPHAHPCCVTWLCTFLAFFCAVSSAAAQNHFDSWTTENGLPNNWVRAIHQTRDGYIWLTTWDGVARFDGVRFRIFNKVNTPGFTTNRFAYRALWEDSQDGLWMGTEDGGVVRYHDGVFTSITAKDGLPGNKILRIDGDAAGTIWITTSAGVVRWRNGHLVLPLSAFDWSLDVWVTRPKSMPIDAQFFGLWRFAEGGWQRFAYGHWSPLPLPAGIRDPANVYVEAMTEDSERRLWYSLRERPHEYYGVSPGHLKVIHGIPSVLSTQICCQDREGRIWMGNHYGAVGLWQDGHFQSQPGISTQDVFQAMEDREGNLWIATFDSGLYRLRSQLITSYRRAAGVQYVNLMGPMLEDRSGAVWVGSGGLTKLEHGRFRTFYRPGQSHNPWLWANWVGALYQDGDDSFWVSTWDGAVLRFKDGRFHEEQALSAGIQGRLNVIIRDRAGDMWFGGDQGLYRLHKAVLTHFTMRDGLPSNVVNAIEQGRAGELWIGTGGGLVQYAGGKLVPFDRLRGMGIESLYEDTAQVWWVGTLDDGLYRLAGGPNDPKITRYTTADGLYSDRVYEVLEDDFGYLWMSCDLGLYRVHKQALNDLAAGRIAQVISTHFGESDGVPGECSAGAQGMAFKARDGRLWFATRDGIAVVDPRAITISSTPPPIRIEDCLVDLHPVACRPALRLRQGHTNLEITYTALSFIKPEQIHFNYELQGLDGHWVEAGTRRTAYYPHLPPGKYVFRVIAANSDGVWNTNGQSLAVIVPPPFYRTWWFLALGSLIAAGAVVMAWQYRVAHLKLAHAAQQVFSRQLIDSQEGERQRIAAELHDSLGQTLLIIKNRTTLALKALGDRESAQEQLDEISASASDAIEEVRTIAYNLRPYQLDRFGLTRTLQAICMQAARSSGIDFSVELDPLDGLFSKQTEINIYRIVQEAVNNIIKHSEASQAQFVIRRQEKALELRIRDNGRGFASAPVPAEPARGGFGLIGMAERARLIGGSCVVDSAPGQGTRVTIKLSLPENEHQG